MINLDDQEILLTLTDLISKDSKHQDSCDEFFKKLVKVDTHKTERIDRILCIRHNKIYLVSIKNNKPNKLEHSIHLYEVRRLDSLASSQLTISTSDKEYKIYAVDATNEAADQSDKLCLNNGARSVDDVLYCLCSQFYDVFPRLTIKDLMESVNIKETSRFDQIYTLLSQEKYLKKKLKLCDNYAKQYIFYCEYLNTNVYQEVIWDVNVILGQNGLREFSLNDFDYVNIKDSFSLLTPLRINRWFDSIHSEGIKLSNEVQEEVIKILTMSVLNNEEHSLKRLSLIQANLKSDFLTKLSQSFSKNSTGHCVLKSLTHINLSRNQLDDRGLTQLAGCISTGNLRELHLYKCSLTSKSINQLFSSLNPATSNLNVIDLSNNHIKEDPVELFKFISEPNQLTELNLASTELDMDKLFISLSKGGCDQNLQKLIINNNSIHHSSSSSKSIGNENIIKFFLNAKSLTHLELSNCKLNNTFIQALFTSLKLNSNLKESSLHMNLSLNDIGSIIKHSVIDIAGNTSIGSLDLSENNLESESDLLINHMQFTRIKSLNLSRNFQIAKPKHITRTIQSLTKWLLSLDSTLQCLYLTDCRLRAHLNDMISELGEFKKLKSLDLSGNEIGDLGFHLLSKSLQVNRSLESLSFDRSNVSLNAYNSILDALKRNSTLNQIHMPMNDICFLYQKAPEKVVDIVKQMTELLSQRVMLNSQQSKCDLNQLFKARMKLIHDSSTLVMTNTTDLGGTVSINSESDSCHESTNTVSIRQILDKLNDSACSYLDERSVEKEFGQYTSLIETKLDSLVSELEKELTATLVKHYPRQAQSLTDSKVSKTAATAAGVCGTLQTINGVKKESCSSYVDSDVENLKESVKEYMNAMLAKMHNDICEMTYKMALTMTEKMISQNQQVPQLTSNKSSSSINKSPISESSASDATNPAPSSSISKKIIGGIKLPFLSFSSSSSSSSNSEKQTTAATSNTTPHETVVSDSMSRSKRPVSTQLFDEAVAAIPTHHLNTSRSNENMLSDLDDELQESKSIDKSTRSRDKTPDDTINRDLLQSDSSKSGEKPVQQSSMPVPAPRKTKSMVKSFFGGLVSNSSTHTASAAASPTAPNQSSSSSSSSSSLTSSSQTSLSNSPPKQSQRKIANSSAISEEGDELERSMEGDNSMLGGANTSNTETVEPKQLEHLNKARARRPNVKRPTVKNPQAKIEIDLVASDVAIPEAIEEAVNSETNSDVKIDTSSSPNPAGLSLNITNDLLLGAPSTTQPKQLSPILKSLPDQPKISLNDLENIKLRKTIKLKSADESPSSGEHTQKAGSTDELSNTPTTTSSASSRVANRLSMFEHQINSGTKLQLGKKTPSTSDQVEYNQSSSVENLLDEVTNSSPPSAPAVPPKPSTSPSSSSGAAKPAPPPNKPLRPAFNNTTNSNTSNANNNNNTAPTGIVPSLAALNVKLRPVSTNNSNQTATSSAGSNSTNIENKLISKVNGSNTADQEKRSSVREIVQMLSEESKKTKKKSMSQAESVDNEPEEESPARINDVSKISEDEFSITF